MRSAVLLLFLAIQTMAVRAQSAADVRHDGQPRIAVFGRDAAVSYMARFADAAGVRMQSLRTEHVLGATPVPIATDILVFLWGDRRAREGSQLDDSETQQAAWREALRRARTDSPGLKIVAAPGAASSVRSWLPDGAACAVDPALDDYLRVGVDRSNLRRLVTYLAVTYANRNGSIEPPDPDPVAVGIYHPDHEGLFADVPAFLTWAAANGLPAESPRRAVVRATSTHFVVRNRAVCDALVAACEQHGVLAFVFVEGRRSDEFADVARSFRARVLLDTRHRGHDVDTLASIDVPALECCTLSRMTIDEWRAAKMSVRQLMGLTTAEAAGVIEPHVVAGRAPVDDPFESAEFVAIPERVERVVARAVRWIELATAPVAERRVAMFVGSMGGGTADNQQLAMPESVLGVLAAMQSHGYTVATLPATPEDLHAAWTALYVPAGDITGLSRLALSGHAALVPVQDYRAWYERFVPASRRAELERHYGPPPGHHRVWRNRAGESFFVLPRLAFGNVALVGSGGLPPGGMEDMAAVRHRMAQDQPLVPSHNQLALAFWLEHADGCDATVHWGSFQFDLLLPEKTVGLDQDDWPDVLSGTLPNVRPFSMAATTFAAPARRRTCAVLINHLTAPLEPAGLADELLELSGDLHKWAELPECSLREQFRSSIEQHARQHNLHVDLAVAGGATEAFADGPWTDAQLRALATWLARVENERITTTSHTFGAQPRTDHMLAQLTATAGRPTWEAIDALFPPAQQTVLPGDATKRGRERTRAVLEAIVRQGLSPADALRALGAIVPEAGLGQALRDDFAMFDRMRNAYARTGDEIRNLLAALDGQYVPPGPAGPPERNPEAVPSGRNTFFANPEELPTKSSWQVATRLVDEMLLERRAAHGGAWPKKVALVVTPRRSLADFGVTEAQAFWLLGVRPVWTRGRVTDFEVVPREELGRPRIDIVLEAKHHYTDYLETRAELIDRAVRTVCDIDEPDNFIRENRLAVAAALRADGVAGERAVALARASIFGVEPGRFGSGLHDKLFEATGVWDTRAQLTEVFLREHDHVYTKGIWGQPAEAAVRAHLRGTDIVLSGLGDQSALSGRAHYSGGNLAAAIEQLSGRSPEYYLADLRAHGDERVERAEVSVRRDIRALLGNRHWIEGMQREGRNGAHRMAALTWKALGWQINRPESITDDVWQTIVDVYLRDRRDLGLPEFFEKFSPRALQEITKNLLEAVRKGYWNPDRATLLEVAATHARSRARHGLLLDDNAKLDRFVTGTLHTAADGALDELVAAMQAHPRSTRDVDAPDPAPDVPVEATATMDTPAVHTDAAAPPVPAPVPVSGTELVTAPAPQSTNSGMWWLLAAVLLLVTIGFVTRRGAA